MKKRLLTLMMTAVLALSAVACTSAGTENETVTDGTETTEAAETSGDATQETVEIDEGNSGSSDKILRTAASFAYASLDVHKEYYGWYTSIYGVSETLFKMDENMNAVPLLAEDAVADGSVWTITLKDGVAFSNGNPLTADMAVRNLQRLAEVNERFAYLADFEMTAVDDKTFTVDTGDVYPTLRNELASPEFGMMDLDATTDFDNDPICTGPFVISKFQPKAMLK